MHWHNQIGGHVAKYTTPTTVNFDLSQELEIPKDRLRPLDEKTVARMMKSFKKHGQLKPILMRVWVRDGKLARTPRLIAGWHRLEAAKRLGWTHILAYLVECSDDDGSAVERDENLIRKELSSDERQRLITEWFAEHPQHAEDADDVANAAALPPLDDGVLLIPNPSDGDAFPAEGAKPDHRDQVSEGVASGEEPEESAVPSVTNPAKPRGGRGKRGGISEASRQLGMSRNTVRKHVPIETDESGDRGKPKPSLRRSEEAQAVEGLAHIRATVAQADRALSRRLTNEAFGSQIVAYRAFRQQVLNCVLAKSDDVVGVR
jgi:ParB/RepB/Spo0J family partition protein